MSKKPREPAIVAVAGHEYTARVKHRGPYKVLRPRGMKVTADGKLSWTPTHDDAPYADVEIKTGAETLSYEVHVVGIPRAIRDEMAGLNRQFRGRDHSFAAFGDSITYASDDKNATGDVTDSYLILNVVKLDSPGLKPVWNRQSGYVFIPRGWKHCSGNGWTSATALSRGWGGWRTTGSSILEGALRNDKPEVATVKFGTNDAGGNMPPATYKANMARITDKVLEANCIPILCVPSRNGWKDRDMTPYREAVRQVAAQKQVPLLDIDMLFENVGTLNCFWAAGNPHPSFKAWGDRQETFTSNTGYGVMNRNIYYVYRHLIDLKIIDAPRGAPAK